MYMVVFVTLMVALIGTFAQIYTKQASSGFEKQTGLADAMVEWHSTAVGLASNFVRPSTIPTLPSVACSLTRFAGGAAPSSTSLCSGSGGGNAYVGMSLSGSQHECHASSGGEVPCVVPLPTFYETDPYTFYSLLFRSSNVLYVLTYVPPPSAASDDYDVGLLCLPGGLSGTCTGSHVQFSSTFKALYNQMKKSPYLTPMSYGTVTASGNLKTPVFNKDSVYTVINYTIPASTIVPVGSIGIISQVRPCSSCP